MERGAGHTHAPALSRQARKAETRRALIDAAAELFAAQGMERTSLDEIAARVGLTKGAIYASFRSKEELIDAVSVEYSQVTDVEPLFDATRGVAARWAALGEQFAAFMPQLEPRSVMLHLEFDLYLQRHPDKAGQDRPVQRAVLEEYGRRLDATARARGEALPIDGAELLVLLLGIARGTAFERLRDPEAVSPAAVARLFALLGRGIEAWSDEAASRERRAENPG
jgi:AcrR family transcriptional regulator